MIPQRSVLCIKCIIYYEFDNIINTLVAKNFARFKFSNSTNGKCIGSSVQQSPIGKVQQKVNFIAYVPIQARLVLCR